MCFLFLLPSHPEQTFMLYILHNLCLWFELVEYTKALIYKVSIMKCAHFTGYFFNTQIPVRKNPLIISFPYTKSNSHNKNWENEKLWRGLSEISAFVSLNIVSKDEIGLLRIVDSFCVFYLQLSILKLLFLWAINLWKSNDIDESEGACKTSFL